MKIAIIGSGIAGISSAYYLARKHQVVLFEANSKLGGHTNTVSIKNNENSNELNIDTGFIVCNPVNYPNFYHFLDELEVSRQNTDMSLGVSIKNGAVEWAGDQNLLKVFAQPSLLFSITHYKMLLSVLKFNKHVQKLLTESSLPNITLGEFLEQHHYPKELSIRYIAAMTGPIWSTSSNGVMQFPFPTFAEFFSSHGLLNVYQRPQWQTILGGSISYINKFIQQFSGEIRLNTTVTQAQIKNNKVIISTKDYKTDLENNQEEFDVVVAACHPGQTLNFLKQPSLEEQKILGDISYTKNEAWLHTDISLMPKRKCVWSAWNALLAEDNLSDEPIGVSYWMNRLQNIKDKTNYILTLNPPHPPAEETVLYKTNYEHPQYTNATIQAQTLLHTIQGKNLIWFAGAWIKHGFHEDGFTSGLQAVSGIDKNCLPSYLK